jgi:hypothetical protein
MQARLHRDWFGDVCAGDPNHNDHHWRQSVSGMMDLVGRFVRPGNVVLDPLLGEGTPAIAALRFGASFIGSDIEQLAIDTTRRGWRMMAYERSGRLGTASTNLHCCAPSVARYMAANVSELLTAAT